MLRRNLPHVTRRIYWHDYEESIFDKISFRKGHIAPIDD